jgi:hypothetical protein
MCSHYTADDITDMLDVDAVDPAPRCRCGYLLCGWRSLGTGKCDRCLSFVEGTTPALAPTRAELADEGQRQTDAEGVMASRLSRTIV